MGLLDTFKGIIPKDWLPEPKVAAAMATSGVVALVAWGLDRKGYKVPRSAVTKVVAGAVTLTGAVVSGAGYMKASKPAAQIAGALS